MCIFHKWIYKGTTEGFRWLYGVTGGIKVPTDVEYQQCYKCGKKKVIKND